MAIEQEWWRNKLAEDIYATLKLKEQAIPHYRAASSQLCIRRHLVDWLSVIVEELGICGTSQHLAVYLLDYFMDAIEVELQYLHLVALTCLLIAVKFEDHCDKIPHYSKLNSYLHVNQYNGGQPYTAKEYLSMELNVLKFIQFELCVPTVAHFLPYFLQVAVDEDDLRNGLPITSKAEVSSFLEKHALYFQEICLQDPQFRDYCPSMVAAACVAASRIVLHLTPTWPKQMELMTDYYLEQLLPCLPSLLGTHHKDTLTSAVANRQVNTFGSPFHHSSPASHKSYAPSLPDATGACFPLPTNSYSPYMELNGSFTKPVYDSYKGYLPSPDVGHSYHVMTPMGKSYSPMLLTPQVLLPSASGSRSYNPSFSDRGSYHPTAMIEGASHYKQPISAKQPVMYSSVMSSYASHGNSNISASHGERVRGS